MTAADLPDEERGIVLYALRMTLRHDERGRRQLLRKRGTKDPFFAQVEGRLDLLEAAYTRLGGRLEDVKGRGPRCADCGSRLDAFDNCMNGACAASPYPKETTT